jgi:hypothetical protein
VTAADVLSKSINREGNRLGNNYSGSPKKEDISKRSGNTKIRAMHQEAGRKTDPEESQHDYSANQVHLQDSIPARILINIH